MPQIDRIIFYADGALDVFGPTAARHPEANEPWLNRELARLQRMGVDLERAEITLPLGQHAHPKLNNKGEIIAVEVEA